MWREGGMDIKLKIYAVTDFQNCLASPGDHGWDDLLSACPLSHTATLMHTYRTFTHDKIVFYQSEYLMKSHYRRDSCVENETAKVRQWNLVRWPVCVRFRSSICFNQKIHLKSTDAGSAIPVWVYCLINNCAQCEPAGSIYFHLILTKAWN